MRYRRGRTRLALALTAAAALLAGLAAAPAHADPEANLGRWQSYLEQPATSNVKAMSATVLSGSVVNARGLTSSGHGDTTLTVTSDNAATVLLDYGAEVEGTPYLNVQSHTGTAPAVSLAFSESKTYLRTPGSGTLASASAAGATAVSVEPGTPSSPLTFAPGDTMTVGSPTETDHIVSVSGTTLTLSTPLADAHPAGATVTSTPGAVTGDQAFQPRQVSLTVTADGTLTSGLMGGLRFEAITLTTPGTLVLSGAGLQFGDGYLATAADYQGFFLSSSNAFNTMYYDGAYTEQTDMQPAGTNGAAEPSVLDGAKRDRAIWSGDLKIEGQGIADTLGTNGDNYVKQSLLTLITSSKQGGGLNADTLFVTGPYSNSYSSWTLDAATTYYRNTGDTAFAEQVLPWLEGQLSYDTSLTDSDGLIVTGPQISTTNGGYDWDFYDGAKTGVVTEFNELYYQDLRDVAYIEASLGNAAKAASYNQTADHVRDEINANLFNPVTGTYYLSESDHSTLAQDANSLAVVLGIAPADTGPRILSALKALWGPHGSEPFSGTTYSNLISPYITAYEVEADYLAGNTADAEQLLNLTWDQMIDPENPFYTGTMWENIGPNGTATEARTSLAHGWASGPTPIMTSYVLGVQPVNPGYQTFTVAPHFGSLQWAEGAVPTPYGRIFVRWARDGFRFALTVAVPAHATAFIDLPGGHRVTLPGGPRGTERTFIG
jgi:Bacterial alpha-L-rhamnosidase C-terminal domain/Bacterial alpha-L-rhamnosidase 6 hairpin glycosidase domain